MIVVRDVVLWMVKICDFSVFLFFFKLICILVHQLLYVVVLTFMSIKSSTRTAVIVFYLIHLGLK